MLKSSKPLMPFFLIYAILLAIGMLVPGMWQPIMLVMFYIAIGQALNIFMGFTGYVNFGYVAFLGVGAYGMAVALAYYPYLGIAAIALGFVIAIFLSVLLSIAVGGVALRLRGAYFAIATIGVNEGLKYLIIGCKIWGGSAGLVLSGTLNKFFGPTFTNILTTRFADTGLIIVAILSGIVAFLILNNKIGYALIALREDEDAAKVMGIDVTKYKFIAFVISSIIAALIGATAWTLKLAYVFPSDVFAISYTIDAIVIVMLGGAGTLLGPVIAGIIYALLKYYLSVILPGIQLLVLAPLLLIIIILFPEGIMGYIIKKVRNTALFEYLR